MYDEWDQELESYEYSLMRDDLEPEYNESIADPNGNTGEKEVQNGTTNR